MRIQLSYANAHLVRSLIAAGAVADVGDNGQDLIEIDLLSGELATIHLMERDIDVELIRTLLNEDAQRKRASLLMLWSSMLLPDDGMIYQPYDWMLALLALYGDKIYAFDVYATSVTFFPVFFDPRPGDTAFNIRYGDYLDLTRIGVDAVQAQSYVRGTWRIVDFEEGHRINKSDRPKEAHSDDGEEARFNQVRGDRNPMWVYYDLLGVTAKDDAETVQRAYRALAMKYHPDLNSSPEATAQMQQINLAYTQIMNLLED